MSDPRITFGTLTSDGTLTNVREISQSDIGRCPHVILMATHYRDDGTCRCDDESHTEMKGWGYRWKEGRWQ